MVVPYVEVTWLGHCPTERRISTRSWRDDHMYVILSVITLPSVPGRTAPWHVLQLDHKQTRIIIPLLENFCRMKVRRYCSESAITTSWRGPAESRVGNAGWRVGHLNWKKCLQLSYVYWARGPDYKIPRALRSRLPAWWRQQHQTTTLLYRTSVTEDYIGTSNLISSSLKSYMLGI